MKRTILLSTICLVLAGCSTTYIATASTSHALDKISNRIVYVEEISSSDREMSKVIRDYIYQELVNSGILITQNKQEATIIVEGNAVVVQKSSYLTMASIDSISLRTTSASNGELLALTTFRTEPTWIFSAGESGQAVAKTLVKQLKLGIKKNGS